MALGCQVTILVLVVILGVCQSARVSQRLVGGHAKVEALKGNKNEESTEEKKTLSQQVAEGKYGLIQSEIFNKSPERLGVLSYEKNPEVPKDNENSLGGLGSDEIWLAEDHLLVLKGGAFHRTASELPWPPIDDYRAPNRQVKIPSQPKVPPPFPVQLEEGGPLQLLGINITGAPNGSITISGPNGTPTFVLPPPYQDPANASAGRAPFPLPPYAGASPENFNRGDGPGPFPFPPPPPPNLNQSLDDDDPSIYYPPPYSFFYPKDNSSKVPPGPLVPGIVLPPPPNFFARLEPYTTSPPTTTTTTTTTTSTTPRPKPPIRYLPYEPPPPKIVTIKPNIIDEAPYDENELSATPSPIISTESPIYFHRINNQQKTRLKPTSPPSTTPSTVYIEEYNNERPPSRVMMPPFEPTVSTVPVIQVPRTYLRPTTVGPIPIIQVSYGGNERPRTYLKQTSGSQTVSPVLPVPVPYNDQRPRTYYKPTAGPQVIQSSPIAIQYLPINNKNRVKPTVGPSVAPVLRIPFQRTQVSSTAVPLKSYFSSVDVDSNSVQPHADYYFYEEDSTVAPPPLPPRQQQQQQQAQRFRFETPSNFEQHIHHLRQQIQSYIKPSARPVYEYSFQAANYRPTKPPARFLTPTPPLQYQNHRNPLRFQEEPQEYYNKHDDRVLDDITKKYFTVFGQKLTTPVTPSLSLAGDTLVNYRKPRPQINPEAEYVNVHQHKQQPGGPGTFISYELPGEGAHFYFLTPQLVQQQEQSQPKPYYYEKPNGRRIPRRNHR